MKMFFRYFLIVYISFLSGFDAYLDVYSQVDFLQSANEIIASTSVDSSSPTTLTNNNCPEKHHSSNEHPNCKDCHTCHFNFFVTKNDLNLTILDNSNLISFSQHLHTNPYLLGIYRPPISLI